MSLCCAFTKILNSANISLEIHLGIDSDQQFQIFDYVFNMQIKLNPSQQNNNSCTEYPTKN